MPRGKTPAATVSPATLLGSSADTFGIHASNSDAWAPPDKELGLTLSQVLHRPSRHSRSRETEAKQSRPNSGKDEAVFDSESSDPHHAPDDDVALGFAVRNLKSIQPDDSAAAESPVAKLEPTETDSGQLAAIAAMFDDDDDDDGYIDDTKRTRQSVKGYSQELDDDIADFIVDDDAVECPAEVSASRHISASAYDSDASARPKFSRGGPDGVMALMPDEFSMFDLPTSFKAYIQYLVYWICNGRRKPVVSETNARYFFQAYIAVARVIDSVEQSVVASSAWVEPFRTSLYSYPDFAYSRISGIPGCDACHFHSNRTATFCVTLSGSPYKRTILAPPMPGEMVSEADVAEGEESDNVVTINDDSEDDSAKGKQAQPHFDYNLGKTCKLRSEICHELHHYLYHLANVVEIHLQTLELDSSQQSASGGGWEDVPPDDLVEMLDKRGQVDDLFQQFKELVSRSKSEFTS
ncbi:hypothetical protein GGI04_001912 [Coemansia thaxteri]|nr:hypothetical protein GGI04_001912 [Coemansia thaxteri]